MTSNLSTGIADTRARAEAARQIVDQLTDDQLIRMNVDEIAATVIGQLYLEPIRADWDRKYLDSGSHYIEMTDSRSVYLSINVPATGLVGMLFKVTPPVITNISSQDGNATISWVRNGSDEHITAFAASLDSHVANWLAALSDGIDRANQMIEAERAALIAEISQCVAPRRNRAVAFAGAAKRLSIPIGPVGDAITIPLDTKAVSLVKLDKAIQSGQPEWKLEDSISNDIVETIRSFSRALERAPLTACKIAKENEEAIRDVLLFILNANYRGMATGETFLGLGKTDLLLRWKDRDAFIGECKIWDGPTKFANAIGQLLGRYTIWRDVRVALIVFIIDRKKPSSLIKEAEQSLRSHPLYCQMDTHSDDPHEYLFRSVRDSERLVRLTFIPVVLNSTVPAVS